MVRPVLMLLVLLGSPISIARAQTEQLIDPATLAALDDPGERQLRIRVVEADLEATEERLAGLPDRTPWHVTAAIGIALAGVGVVGEVVALLGLAFAELGSGIACGVSTVLSDPCSARSTPTWIIATAIAGAPTIVAGLVTLLVGVSQLDSIDREEARIELRRDGRLRELELLRSFDVRVTGDSIWIGARGSF